LWPDNWEGNERENAVSIGKNAAVILMTAVAYVALYKLNDALFSGFCNYNGVSFIYLPSGLRMLLVLLFLEQGAIGIALASMFISYYITPLPGPAGFLAPGLISGFAPWLARIICVDKLKLHVELQQLTATTLLKMAVVFALTSAVLHQLWFTWQGQTDSFIRNTAAMAIGDLIGTLAMLYAAKAILSLFPVPAAEPL
jgi:hypothetical protein